jgi:hypothetical protein
MVKKTNKTIEVVTTNPCEIHSNVFENKIIWDATTVEVVQTVAQALLNLTYMLSSQQIHITGVEVHPSEYTLKKDKK